MNAYSKIIQIDPENMEAKNRIKMIQSILNFWNPEMFNPYVDDKFFQKQQM